MSIGTGTRGVNVTRGATHLMTDDPLMSAGGRPSPGRREKKQKFMTSTTGKRQNTIPVFDSVG